MAYSPSRGLLYSAPPSEESNRRTDTDASADESDPSVEQAEQAVEASDAPSPTPADD